MTNEELEALYEALSYPSPLNFRRAVLKEGGTLSIKAAKEFVSTYSQRQVTARRQKYDGKITAPKLDSRWSADLISYVAQPAVFEGKKHTHVLVVQDIFSRQIWARALRTAKTTEVVKEFKDILEVSERKPLEMNADRGVEFQSKEFKAMLETQGIKIFREAVSKNDLATLDRAIATLKQIITRRVVSQGTGNWVEELQTGVRSYNMTAHTHISGCSHQSQWRETTRSDSICNNRQRWTETYRAPSQKRESNDSQTQQHTEHPWYQSSKASP
jgi:transposase InsO family protein